jgi:Tol biopolymer transport system component
MCSRRSFTSWGLATAVRFAVSGKLSSQTVPPGAGPTEFTSHVYAWFPDNTVRRISPGPAAPGNAAMSAGPFTQADVNPDGRSAVFWGGLEGRPRVWLYDFGTKAARVITRGEVASVEPSFDSQGRRVVFAADSIRPSPRDLLAGSGTWRRGNMNLFIVDSKGKGLRQITHGEFQDARPVFSPDGRDVVFLSNRDGNPRGLYLVPIDGSAKPQRLLQEGGIVRPWYSPDAKFIYFSFVNVKNDYEVRMWRVPATGGAREPITPEGLPNSQGGFADPDGIHLWFHSTNFDSDRKTVPYQFNLETHELRRMMPPGFTSAGHLTRAKTGLITFDSMELDPSMATTARSN